MKRFCSAVLVLATACTGLMAGLALTYSVAVMPGLADTDDRTFVESFQHMDHALDESVWFWVSIFIGGIVLILLAILLTSRLRLRSVRAWLIVAATLYAATIAITGIGIDALESAFGTSAGSRESTSPAEVRGELDEDRWRLLNDVRLATNLGAFMCLAWSLVVFGRSTDHPGEQEPVEMREGPGAAGGSSRCA